MTKRCRHCNLPTKAQSSDIDYFEADGTYKYSDCYRCWAAKTRIATWKSQAEKSQFNRVTKHLESNGKVSYSFVERE